MKERRDSLLKQTQKMCQIVLKHIFVMKAKHPTLETTFRERTERRVIDHDNLSHESIVVNEVKMHFRFPGLSHSVVKHVQSTRFHKLIQKLRTTQIETLFNKIYDKIKHITHLVQNQRK